MSPSMEMPPPVGTFCMESSMTLPRTSIDTRVVEEPLSKAAELMPPIYIPEKRNIPDSSCKEMAMPLELSADMERCGKRGLYLAMK